MENQNKIGLTETTKEFTMNIREICRFCLSKTENDVSIKAEFISEESKEIARESIYSFMTKLRFIKLEDSQMFPSQVCQTCYQLVHVCYDFKQICQKSDKFLRDFYESSLKKPTATFEFPKCSGYADDTQNLSDHNRQDIQQMLNNFPTVINDISRFKNSGQKLYESISTLKLRKQNSWTENSNITLTQSPVPNQCTYDCSECYLKFTNQEALNFHFVATHGGKKLKSSIKLQCKKCNKSFKNQERLERHYRVIHKITEIPDEILSNKGFEKIQMEKIKFFCFQCVPCKEFQSHDNLIQHVEHLHKNKPKNVLKLYTCSYCNNTSFKSRQSLNQHLTTVHKLNKENNAWKNSNFVPVVEDSKSNTQPESGGQPQVSALLQVLDTVVDSLNVVQQEEGFKILCKKCNPPFELNSVNDFAKHIRTNHEEKLVPDQNGSWNCSECSASYSRKQTLHHHMREKHKHSVGGAKCPDCPEYFITNRRLILHGISVHQKYFAYSHDVFKRIIQPETEAVENPVMNFECDVCQRKYTYKSSLRKHIVTTHLGEVANESVACPYCGKKISSKLNLKSHIEFAHEALFVSCPICKKKINFRTIGKHYKTHRTESGPSKNSFLCNLCGKILKSRRSFEDHQKLHRNARDELCDVCGSGFTSKKLLRAHKKTHEGGPRAKAFGCDQCEKVFSGKHTLNRHLLTHSGKKNFICEICSKCFYTLQELNRHVRSHKKEYRFDCGLCDMKFLDKSRFRHHMMRHRNVRPHKCHFCEKMFIVRGKMNLHMATKHNFEVANSKGVWKDPKTYVSLDDLL